MYKLCSPLLLVFLVCGGKDFLKFRPVRLGMTSALALDAVLSSNTGHAVVGFTAPSAAVSFHHNGNKKIKLAVSNQSTSHQRDTFLLPPFKNATTQTSLAVLHSYTWKLLHSGFAWISRHPRFCTLSHSGSFNPLVKVLYCWI